MQKNSGGHKLHPATTPIRNTGEAIVQLKVKLQHQYGVLNRVHVHTQIQIHVGKNNPP